MNIQNYGNQNPLTVQNTGYPQTININGEMMEIIPLGAGSEVGRSCIIIKFQGNNIMLDCGIHPAFTGVSSLPYFDEIDPSKIDLLLVTHFHLDHCGALPYFLEKTTFEGECYMTHPTKANYKLIIADYIKISHGVNEEEALFKEKDLKKSYSKIKVVDYHQEIITKKGVKFIAYNAGHVLGSAMFLLEISGVKVLYTGDYSRETERHLKPAEIIPKADIQILIVESTYGIHLQPNREERENDFTKFVDEIVTRGGKCLLPVFATGRVQELLLILDEYWEANKRLQNVKIYYASSLATNSFEIFKTYINMAGDYIKQKVDKEGVNPFDFKHILCVKGVEHLDETKPVVVFASPGFMQSGLSRTLFEQWCEDSKNGIVITGYCVDGTLARYLLGEPSMVTLLNNKQAQMRMSVKNVTFSAHSDFAHTNEFIQTLKPKNIILVHGEGKEMERLRTEYERLKHENDIYKSFMPRVFNPKNCQKIQFNFKIQKHGYIIGSLTNEIRNKVSQMVLDPSTDTKFISSGENKESDKMDVDDEGKAKEEIQKKVEDQKDYEDNYFLIPNGVLIESDNLLVDKNELHTYSNIQSIKFKQILTVKYTLCKEFLINLITDYFHEVKQSSENPNVYTVCEIITMYLNGDNVVLEWYSSGYNDFLSNSLAMTISQLETTPNGSLYKHYENRNEMCSFKKERLLSFLKTKYADVRINQENQNSIIINDEGKNCEIFDFGANRLAASDEEFENKVKKDLEFFNEL